MLSTAEWLSAKVRDNSPLTEADEDVRLAVQRLIIALGDETERLRKAVGIDTGVEPWTSWAGVRNVVAHQHPSEVIDARLWQMAVDDVPALVSEVGRVMWDQAHPGGE